MNLLAWFGSGKYDLKVFAPQNVKPWDRARNLCHKEFLESKHDYLFFLDANTIPQQDIIDRLLAHDAPIVSGLVQIWQEHLLPMAMRWNEEAGGYKPNYGEGLQAVDVTTNSCTLIKREVMKAVKRPAFAFPHDDEFGISGLSEDFYFCERVREAGFPIAVDFDAVCDHDIHTRSLAVNRELVSNGR